MFEFLFKYPATVFSKGQFVLLSAWPAWVLGLAIVAIALGLAWHVRQRRGFLTGARPVAIWLLETLLAALVLFLLWHPAISIATLRPQQASPVPPQTVWPFMHEPLAVQVPAF